MNIILSRRTIWATLAIVFLLFIFWIIIMADIGRSGTLGYWVKHLPFGDKFAHFLLYGVLSFLVCLALNNKYVKLFNHHFLLGAVLVFGFAFLEEFTQIALSTRNFEWMDILCDLVGIALFSRLALIVGKRQIK